MLRSQNQHAACRMKDKYNATVHEYTGRAREILLMLSAQVAYLSQQPHGKMAAPSGESAERNLEGN
jgi:hypothetical protein